MGPVLVTGASGMIGRHLLQHLESQREVIALGRHAPQSTAARFLECDLAQDVLPDGMPVTCDTVIHLAQSVHFREFPDQANDIFRVNVGSTQRLLDWAKRAGVRRFVYASSGGIYGHGEEAFREDAVLRSGGELGFYLASKNCAELLVENYAAYMTVFILRFFFVYGPGQRDNMLMPRLIRSVQRGQPITLQGSEGVRMNPIFVSDAVRAIIGTLNLDSGQKINVAGSEVVSLRSLGILIGRLVNREPHFQRQDGEPRHLVGDVTKMVKLLGAPVVRLNDGLKHLIAAMAIEI
jgi:UDP-glucose 4-epimerase